MNPFVKDGVELWAALGFYLPYDTLKCLLALSLLEDAKSKGLIVPNVTRLVESTSGATGVPLTHFALSEYFSAREVVLVMKKDVPLGKSAAPDFAGARIIPPWEKKTPIQTARAMGENGFLNLDQYRNLDGPKLYRTWAAPQIFRQVPHPNMLVAPVGTGGTIIGFSEAFRSQNENVAVVGAMCGNKVEIPGMRSPQEMEDVRLPWRDAIDLGGIVEVEQQPSYLAAVWLQWADSHMAGLSCGATLVATYLNLKERKDMGMLDEIRESGSGKISVVMIFHDNARPYLVDRFPMLHGTYQNRETAPLPWELLWAA